MIQCPKCASQDIDLGIIRERNGIIEIGYHSNNDQLFKNDQIINAYVCINCGYTEFYTNTEHFKKTLKTKGILKWHHDITTEEKN